MTDTNSTTTAPLNAGSNAGGIPSEASGSTSGAPATPSNPENAVSKAQAGATVPQALFDRVHADFQAVTKRLSEVSAERDEAKAYASNLSAQLAEAAKKVEDAAKADAGTVYTNSQEEIVAIKARITSLLDEAKTLSGRLTDLAPRAHPISAIEQGVNTLIQKVRQHF